MNPDKEAHADYGDCYTFTAIDLVSKLMPCWLVGQRTPEATEDFMNDMAPRFAKRIQLTMDGWGAYRLAMDMPFGGAVDYAIVNKTYAAGAPVVEGKRRYSSAPFVSCTKKVVLGKPGKSLISTSLVERAGEPLDADGNARFTRLTNSFSKKLENHMHAVSFYFMVYNFVKIHSCIKTTPGMEADGTDFLWSMEDIVLMAETNA